MQIVSYYKALNELYLTVGRVNKDTGNVHSTGKMQLQLWDSNRIRVRYTWKETFSEDNGFMLVSKPSEGIWWEVDDEEDCISVTTEKIKLVIYKDSASFSWFDKAGNLLVKEPRRGGKWLDEVNVDKYIYNPEEKARFELQGYSWGADVKDAVKVFDRKAYSTRVDFIFSEDEAIYGLGQHEEGILNYRGHCQNLYQQNRKLPMPIFVSTRGYGFFFNSYSLSSFHDDEHGSYFWTEVDDEMDHFFIYGPEFDSIVSSIRSLTGTSVMLPLWTYGYWQSKEHYESAKELQDVVNEYRERNIPIDGIVQDWQYWPGKEWGEKYFDPERYPDPYKMVEKLHESNVRLMISLWPHLGNGGKNHTEMREKGLLLGNDSCYNAFDPRARELFWQQTKEGLGKYGIDAWWCDGTEPFDGMRPYKMREQICKIVHIDTTEFKKYMDAEYINAFPLLNAMMMYDGNRAEAKGKRMLNLTRACYPGQQRYGTVVWSGDITATWEVYKRHIADGLNFCITGHTHWTLDIGAFFVKNLAEECWWHAGDYPMGPEDEAYKELFVRWFQFGTFLPMFRVHGTDFAKEIWRFGNPGDIAYDTLVKFIHLRYRLLPYIYSVAGLVTHRSYTMMRSLSFDFRNDRNVYDINDQYMFGPAMMVCPVVTPMYYDTGSRKIEGVGKIRKVYLPQGPEWCDFWTGSKYEGGQYIHADASYGIMPIFIKAGSIIPLGPVVQHSQESLAANRELRIYPGNNGEFEIYEDAGDGYQYEQGEFAWTKLIWNDEDRTLAFMKREGGFHEMVKEREFKVIIVGEGHGTGLEQEMKPDAVVRYTGEEIKPVEI